MTVVFEIWSKFQVDDNYSGKIFDTKAGLNFMVTEDTPKMPTTISSKGISSNNSITNLALSSMFWTPIFMTDSDWLEHIPFAFWLIEAHKPSTLLEIGSTTGVSYFAMCQAVDRLNLDTRCFAISQLNEKDTNSDPDGSRLKTLQSHNRSHYSSFSNLLTNSRTQALEYFDDGSIDLIHIKDLKGHDQDRQLINSWIQKLSESGLLLLHGTGIRAADNQLHRLFSELKQTYSGFEFKQSKGLGVLGVGHHQSELIDVLFNESDSRGRNQVVQDVFSRLGQACADSYAARVNEEYLGKIASESRALKTELESKEESLQQALETLEVNRGKMKELESQTSHRVEIQALERGQLVERCSMLQDLQEQLKQHTTELQDALKQHQIQLTAKEKEFAELSRTQIEKNQQLTTAIGERDKLALNAAELEKQTRDLEAKLTESKQRLADLESYKLDRVKFDESSNLAITDLKSKLADKDVEIEQKRIELKTLTEKLEISEVRLGKAQTEIFESVQKIEKLQNSLDERFIEIGELVKLTETRELEFHTKLKAEQSRTVAGIAERDKLIKKLENKLEAKDQSLAIRTEEIAKLTHLLELLEKKTKTRAISLVASNENTGMSLESLPANQIKTRKIAIRDLALAGKHTRLIEQSGLFDAAWYLTQYEDVKANKRARKNPARHYLLSGGFEARDPSEQFNSSWYLQQNPDVLKQGMNPLVHYLLHGKNEGRAPKPSMF